MKKPIDVYKGLPKVFITGQIHGTGIGGVIKVNIKSFLNHIIENTPEKSWEIRFNKEFLTPEGFWNKENDMYPFKVKDFITNLLNSL